jgi:hypothetical protein
MYTAFAAAPPGAALQRQPSGPLLRAQGSGPLQRQPSGGLRPQGSGALLRSQGSGALAAPGAAPARRRRTSVCAAVSDGGPALPRQPSLGPLDAALPEPAAARCAGAPAAAAQTGPAPLAGAPAAPTAPAPAAAPRPPQPTPAELEELLAASTEGLGCARRAGAQEGVRRRPAQPQQQRARARAHARPARAPGVPAAPPALSNPPRTPLHPTPPRPHPRSTPTFDTYALRHLVHAAPAAAEHLSSLALGPGRALRRFAVTAASGERCVMTLTFEQVVPGGAAGAPDAFGPAAHAGASAGVGWQLAAATGEPATAAPPRRPSPEHPPEAVVAAQLEALAGLDAFTAWRFVALGGRAPFGGSPERFYAALEAPGLAPLLMHGGAESVMRRQLGAGVYSEVVRVEGGDGGGAAGARRAAGPRRTAPAPARPRSAARRGLRLLRGSGAGAAWAARRLLPRPPRSLLPPPCPPPQSLPSFASRSRCSRAGPSRAAGCARALRPCNSRAGGRRPPDRTRRRGHPSCPCQSPRIPCSRALPLAAPPPRAPNPPRWSSPCARSAPAGAPTPASAASGRPCRTTEAPARRGAARRPACCGARPTHLLPPAPRISDGPRGAARGGVCAGFGARRAAAGGRAALCCAHAPRRRRRRQRFACWYCW